MGLSKLIIEPHIRKVHNFFTFKSVLVCEPADFEGESVGSMLVITCNSDWMHQAKRSPQYEKTVLCSHERKYFNVRGSPLPYSTVVSGIDRLDYKHYMEHVPNCPYRGVSEVDWQKAVELFTSLHGSAKNKDDRAKAKYVSVQGNVETQEWSRIIDSVPDLPCKKIAMWVNEMTTSDHNTSISHFWTVREMTNERGVKPMTLFFGSMNSLVIERIDFKKSKNDDNADNNNSVNEIA
ncbi:hypothetical protein Fot_11868 [Forsythia ovata]|uniref:Uncharacterized protein n=1 Tax=Forsythia ovata TaxID=205694 RepID=A0ABD1WNR5_9LAMI